MLGTVLLLYLCFRKLLSTRLLTGLSIAPLDVLHPRLKVA